MPKITRITAQKKNDERFNVYIDKGGGEEFGFGVDQDVLIKFNLRKGKELTEEEIVELHDEEEYRKTYTAAVRYLGHRMRSGKELKDYLAEKEYPAVYTERAIQKLSEMNYINDAEFAVAYVRTQMRTTQKGPGAIRQELIKKGLSEAEIEAGLAEYPSELQVENAVKLARKKAAQNKKNSPKETRKKLEMALMQKGYPSEVIRTAAEQADTGTGEEERNEALEYQGNKAHRRYSKYEGWEYVKRMKQFLFRKGFSMEEIDRFIEEKKEGDG
ncbi:recombination regulator RecX [Bacillus marinisedimentorum]|uniref:recombination regulator RecX n=1 Tax=Bacillus marinisedimentorum TaxID=1821260 RepID=UPI00087298AF|nr:recombination regulator RecX [Bacillus marinisedimentorum]